MTRTTDLRTNYHTPPARLDDLVASAAVTTCEIPEEYFTFQCMAHDMTKHTGRDSVWHEAIQRATNEESFKLTEISEEKSVDISTRTIRDTLNTMADLGWLSKETPQSHEWHPGPLALGQEPEDNTTESVDAASVNGIETPSDLSKGEIYVGVVDRITGSGNAIVSVRNGHVNLGPIDESAVEEKVRFRSVNGSHWGHCLEEQYTYDGYDPRDGTSPSRGRRTSLGSKKKSTNPYGGKGEISDPDNKNKLLNGKL
jgi:hypothetical protein